MLGFKRVAETASPLTRGSAEAAGADICSAYEYLIKSNSWCLVKTGLILSLPEGTYGRIAPRSGLALYHGISVGAGVIDRDYTGEIGIVLFNHGNLDFKITQGDRIAQIICEKIIIPELIELQVTNVTQRGDLGFGSTGLN